MLFYQIYLFCVKESCSSKRFERFSTFWVCEFQLLRRRSAGKFISTKVSTLRLSYNSSYGFRWRTTQKVTNGTLPTCTHNLKATSTLRVPPRNWKWCVSKRTSTKNTPLSPKPSTRASSRWVKLSFFAFNATLLYHHAEGKEVIENGGTLWLVNEYGWTLWLRTRRSTW